MERTRSATVIHILDAPDALDGRRTDLVRVPAGASDSIFGGWGVRI
jgi:hypothetical protein